MRTFILVLAGCVLCLCGCGKKADHAPPQLNKQLLNAKWKNTSEALLILGYEFADGGHVKMKVKGMKQVVPGSYSWSGDRTLEMDFHDAPSDVKQAYKDAAKAYKDDVKARVKAKKLSDKAEPSLLGAVHDELPAKIVFPSVSISEKPPLLIFTNEKGATQNFERAD